MENNHISLKKTTGNRLKSVRKTIGLTQNELASMLKMDRSSITSIEKGKAFPSIPIMLFLKEKYRASPLWIMTGEGDMFLKEVSLSDFVPDDTIELVELCKTVPEIKRALLSRLDEAKKLFKDKIPDQAGTKKKSSSGDTGLPGEKTG